MANIFEVKGDVLVRKVALRLKEQKIPKPAYVDYVKTSPSKERIPQDSDFWYFRCASVLRQVYINGPVGVSKLRTRFGTVVKEHPEINKARLIVKAEKNPKALVAKAIEEIEDKLKEVESKLPKK